MAFLDKMKVYLDKGIEVSKEAFSKAGDAVQDFGDKSVTKIELHQLISHLDKEYKALGLAVQNFFKDNPTGSLDEDSSSIRDILQEIARLEKKITEREEILRSTKSKTSDDERDTTDSFTGASNTSFFTSTATDSFNASSFVSTPTNTSVFEDSADATDAEFTKSE